MARKVYYVVLHQSEWKIKFEDTHYGPYDTQKAAIRKAIDWAHADGKAGHDAEVRVQAMNHLFRTEWTYGHDPYPPKG